MSNYLQQVEENQDIESYFRNWLYNEQGWDGSLKDLKTILANIEEVQYNHG